MFKNITSEEVAALLSGMVGLGLQILAGRLLTPVFGSSIFVWGSIIGVFMASLGMGYHFGGKRSANISKENIVNNLLWVTGFIGVLVYFGESLARYMGSLPLPAEYAAIPAVALLFGPSSFLIGQLAPYIISLSDRYSKGEASGRIFTFDTTGSIIGVFGTTFLLIPFFHLTVSFVILGLIALAAVWVLKPRKLLVVLSVLFAVALLMGLSTEPISYVTDGELVYETQTAYQKLEVRDINGLRLLWLDGQLQSAMDLNNPTRHVIDYTSYFHLPMLLTEVDSVLFVGGGGFTGPRIFNEMGIEVDVVEIDSEVVDAAERYFEIDESETDITVKDARQFLQQSDKTYDLIVLDAYRHTKVPFHLTTREFYQVVYESLEIDGVALTNIIDEPGGRFFRSKYKTISSVFPTVYAFKTTNGMGVQNLEIVATKTPEISRNRWFELSRMKDVGENLTTEISLLMDSVNTSGVDVLLDAKAPVDMLIAR